MSSLFNRVRRATIMGSIATIAVFSMAGITERPACAQGTVRGIEIRQSAGPVSATRNQSVLIGLLLPAVKKTSDAPVRVKMRFFDTLTGKTLADKAFDVQRGGPGAFLYLYVTGDGSVFVGDAKEPAMRLAENQRNLMVSSQIVGVVKPGAVAPTDISASVQVFDAEMNVRTTVPFHFLPAVQMGDGSV